MVNFVVLAGQVRHNLLDSDQEGEMDGLVFDSQGFPAKCGGMAKIASVIESKSLSLMLNSPIQHKDK